MIRDRRGFVASDPKDRGRCFSRRCAAWCGGNYDAAWPRHRRECFSAFSVHSATSAHKATAEAARMELNRSGWIPTCLPHQRPAIGRCLDSHRAGRTATAPNQAKDASSIANNATQSVPAWRHSTPLCYFPSARSTLRPADSAGPGGLIASEIDWPALSRFLPALSAGPSWWHAVNANVTAAAAISTGKTHQDLWFVKTSETIRAASGSPA